MYCMISVVATHCILGYILVIHLEYGIIGAAMGFSFAFTFCFVLLNIIACSTKELHEMYFWFNSDTFKDLGPYLELAIPGALLLFAEMCFYEILTLLSGFLDIKYTAS